jgi:uncharacterized membrane protein
MSAERGQALVETAISLPILLGLFLGGVETAFLMTEKWSVEQRAAVLAAWVAAHPGEDPATAAAVLAPGCSVAIEPVDPDLVRASIECRYRSRIVPIFEGVAIGGDGLAVAR